MPLADRRDGAEQVAGALARRPDPSLAARSDPWLLDSQLRERIAEHERVLATRPADRREALVTATKDLQAAENCLADREATTATLAQFDAALDHTRADRVRALADDPLAHLVERLGPVPGSPGGRAVWCHHALGIEAVLDRSDALGAPPTGRSPAMARARQDVAIADRLLQSIADVADPAGWAELADWAAALRKEAQRFSAARATIDRLVAPAQWVQPSHGMGDPARQAPEVSL